MAKLQRKIDFKLDGVTISSCRSYWHDKAFKILQSHPERKIKKISIHCSNCGFQLLWVTDTWSKMFGPYGITPCPNCFPDSEIETLVLCKDCGKKKVFTYSNPYPYCPIHEKKEAIK